MIETKGLLNEIKHHERLPISVNENCSIPLPENILEKLFQPHRLSFYYFMFMDRGEANFKADLQDISISDGQLVFGLPNQVFANFPYRKGDQHYALSFDENTLALLPNSYPFLVNPLNKNTISFEPVAQKRVKAILSFLFQLLHASAKQKKTALIVVYLNTLLTEFNNAYFEQYGYQETFSDSKLSKYLAFKMTVETHLTAQQDVQSIAKELTMTTTSLYSIVKEFSGVSPKEWMTNRLILEAQRKLQYAKPSVKELAYELGFNDPGYFSRLFKKSTGKSVRNYLSGLQDLSHN